MLDRTALILEIFGERAATREGVLQVELAHLNYQKSRLVRSWTHLERQRGGFGFLGGPGETQIESDRRQLRTASSCSRSGIEKVQADPRPAEGQARRRAVPDRRPGRLHQRRQIQPVQRADRGGGVRRRTCCSPPSTPLSARSNCRTAARSCSPTPSASSPTCPPTLVAAFRATLEEVVEADVILHVRDIANPDHAGAGRRTSSRCSANSASRPTRRRSSRSGTRSTRCRPMPMAAARRWRRSRPPARWPPRCRSRRRRARGSTDCWQRSRTRWRPRSRDLPGSHAPHAAGADVGWLYGHAEIIGREEPDEAGQTYEVRVEPRHKRGLLRALRGPDRSGLDAGLVAGADFVPVAVEPLEPGFRHRHCRLRGAVLRHGGSAG